jgi:peptide/nickel transport system substrate-binding protein
LRRSTVVLALLLSLSLVAAACGDDDGGAGSATTAEEEVVKGGTLVIGAEQQGDCADWLGSCSGATWGIYTIQQHTLPRAFNVKSDGEYEPSVLLAGEPAIESEPAQKVTYEINPSAVWSDGEPITSTDFKYTWDQVKNGTDIYDKTGYKDIESVDDTDPKTVVVTFSTPYADWKDLFGGGYGVLPSHLLQGKDRSTELKDGYTFSGGPWKLDHWTKDTEIKLVPNDAYWGPKPNLDAVVFKIITDTAAEIQAYKTGQVAAIYPQVQLELSSLKEQADTSFSVTPGFSYEAIWFNTSKAPLDSQAVRQALAYATDRNAIVERLFGPVSDAIEPIQSFTTPRNKSYYNDAFAKYDKDLSKVDELMSGDGWTKGSDGIWAKNGQKASLTVRVTAGNKRRELTEQILQSQWKEAGFDLKVDNQRSNILFGQTLPAGDFQVAIYAQIPYSKTPAQCVNFCSENIPTETNTSGVNYFRLSDAEVDSLWKQVDQVSDETERADLVKRGTERLAELVPALPLDPFPNTVVYNTAEVGGDIVDNPSVLGMFWNLNTWYCKGGTC